MKFCNRNMVIDYPIGDEGREKDVRLSRCDRLIFIWDLLCSMHYRYLDLYVGPPR